MTGELPDRSSRASRLGLLACLASVLLLSLVGGLTPLQRGLGDARFAVGDRPASGEIAFVAIDSESLAAVGQWPWPRSLHADIVDAVLAAGAYDIFLDIDFSTQSTPEGDAALEAALEASGGFARLAAFSQQNAQGEIFSNVPLSRFLQHVDPFAVNVATDDKGRARRVPHAIAIDGRTIPSFATLLAPGPLDDPLITIDFGISAQTISTLSAIDLLEGRFAPEDVANKRVIYGASAFELQDVLFTPNQGALPGPIVQALAAESVLQGRTIEDIGPVPAFVLLAILGLAASLFGRQVRSVHAIMAFIAVAVAAEGAAHLAYQGWALMVDTAPLHVGIAVLVAWQVFSANRVRSYVISLLTGQHGQMRNVVDRLVDDSSDGIVVVDAAFDVLAASGPAKTWFAALAIGQPADDALPDIFVRALRDALGDQDAGGQAPLHWAGDTTLDMAGSQVPFEFAVTVSPARFEGGSAFAALTFRDITARRQFEQRLAHLAEHDPLTGALVRGALIERLDARMAASGEVAVMVLALRRFSSVNATLGHQAGDVLLKQVVARLTTLPHAAIARLGGDRFAVSFEGDSVPQDPQALYAAIKANITERFDLDGHRAAVGVSAGWSGRGTARPDGEALLRGAEMAVSLARSRHGNHLVAFDPGMETGVDESRALEHDLRIGLDNGQLSLAYQPQIELADGRLVGVEALLRWSHPDRGSISPAVFIPLAEETGLIVEIGRYVLREACLLATQIPDTMRVAVNVSPMQIEMSDIVADVTAALEASGLSPHRLEIEVTEGVLIGHAHTAIVALNALRDMGITIAIDDFGTGFSSLSYLATLPFDVLKIDQSFVRELETSPSAFVVVETIIALGARLGKAVLAEGIETEAQARCLQSLGCALGQGYHFSKPLGQTDLGATIADLMRPAPQQFHDGGVRSVA